MTAEALDTFHDDLQGSLVRWSDAPDEAGLDPLWSQAKDQIREFTLRPAKRVRPTLLALGWLVARGDHHGGRISASLVQFATGLELLHTFMLVHDDVADRANTRRGGRCLHHLLAPGRLGEDLAIVAGDHLYARAMEAMFSAGSAQGAAPHHVSQAAQFMLEVCRHTAAGQHLDLVLSRSPLRDVTLFRTLKVAELKTARYGFVAPLACGAMLAGASPAQVDGLKRVGRHAGLAFQLHDDLLGLFGDDMAVGKDGGGDYLEAKRTFPVIAAWVRADEAGQRELEALWQHPDSAQLEAARATVRRWGGLEATQRVIAAQSRSALKALKGLPRSSAAEHLGTMLERLARRPA